MLFAYHGPAHHIRAAPPSTVHTPLSRTVVEGSNQTDHYTPQLHSLDSIDTINCTARSATLILTFRYRDLQDRTTKSMATRIDADDLAQQLASITPDSFRGDDNAAARVLAEAQKLVKRLETPFDAIKRITFSEVPPTPSAPNHIHSAPGAALSYLTAQYATCQRASWIR